MKLTIEIQKLTEALLWIGLFVVVVFLLNFFSFFPSEHAWDKISTISCKSDSMNPTFGCNDVVYSTKIKPDETLYPGYIYTYLQDNNRSIAHRLIACLDPNCNQTVFKGDKNLVGELVNRSQIKYKVMMVKYQ